MNQTHSQLLKDFESFETNAAEFKHLQHVQVAFGMLQKYRFTEAVSRYSESIETIATRAGAADKFNITITVAFLSIIAERMHDLPDTDLDGFLSANQDLLDKNLLKNWYTDERLQSDAARQSFLLPDRNPL